ncbi:tenascin-N-like [Mixophyes fleayi]|uniref:tenascin-N-like n=1 Tax=Mixophyes fleayi TaxID=3061075 RepID=UPI003F4DDD71
MDHITFSRALLWLLLCCPCYLLTSAAAIYPSETKDCSSEKELTITHIYSAPGEDNAQIETVESGDNSLVFRHRLRLQTPTANCERDGLLSDLLARLLAVETEMKEMKGQYEGCCAAAALQNSCSGNGKFVPALGICQCNDGWEGPDCATKSCPGNCAGNGVCIDGVCQCAEGFTGEDCSEKKCAYDCGKFGTCVDGGCRCLEGYSGPACRKKKCPVDCSPNGKCVDGICQCSEGYTGLDCKEKTCDVDCRPNGRCVNGQCVCNAGFMGTDCKEKACAVDCRPNGRCVNGQCVCNAGFMGTNCKEKACAVDCRPNGRCVNGKCVCNAGFMGTDCKDKKCAVDCRPNGRCVNGQCVCNAGFMGTDCSIEMASLCSFHGKFQLETGKCVCDEGWEGPDCSQKSCPNNCANNGVCVNGVCQCASGFTGPDCSEKECDLDCGENGKCVDGACQCNAGWTGTNCNLVDCLVNCGDNGRCDGGQCFCEEGFVGDTCSEVMAVENLRLISTTEDSLNIAWDMLVDVDYYYISYYPFGNEGLKKQIKVSANQDFYQIGGLSASTLYKIFMYQVKNGVTSEPAEIQGRTGDSALGSLGVTEETEDSLEVEWENPATKVDYFKLKYGAQPSGAESEVQVSQSSDTKSRYIIKGLQPSTTYDINVWSVRGGGEGKVSTVVGTTGMDGPKNLVDTDMGEDTASLSWEAARGQIDRYIISYASPDGHSEEVTVDKKETSTSLTGLTPGLEYVFQIWAEKGSKRSKRASVTAVTDIDAPKNLQASEITQTETTLTWTPPTAQIDGYTLVYEDEGGNRQEIELDAASKSYELKGLKKGTQYTVYLVAYRGNRKSRQATTMFYTVSMVIMFPVDCAQVRLAGNRKSGVYTIYPGGDNSKAIRAFCDQDTDNGGWTVFQRRTHGTLDFYQRWRTYVDGFGDPNDEFWLGLEWIHKLTTSPVKYELRVDLRAGNESAYAVYRTFIVGSSRDRYKLTVGDYSGTAGDALGYHNGWKFSTWDRDNDIALTNCALSHRGAFWYKNCHLANPNGQYGDFNHSQGVNWEPWKGHEFSIPAVEMKIRPLSGGR